MIILIAWRNVWRNRTRSLVVIAAIAVGICAVALAVSFINSFSDSMIRNAINNDYGHFQLHHPDFIQEPEARFNIPSGEKITTSLKGNPEVKAFSSRMVLNGMIASPRASAGAQIYGIIPAEETKVTQLNTLLEEGNYFDQKQQNAILISQKTAGKLKVKIRSKIVLTFQDLEGNVVAGAFRIQGIFNSPSPRLNENAVYIRKSDLAALLGTDTLTHEISILLQNPETLGETTKKLKQQWPEIDVKSWNELAPELQLIQQQSSLSMVFLLAILMIALAFGIVNTMLMAVLERERELGMLMAVGMNRRRIFGMILTETLFLSVVGGPVGCALGFAVVHWLGMNGVDLSAYAQGLQQYGYNTRLYPYLLPQTYFIMAGSVMLTALLAAIYPAFKAVRLNPAEAMRS